MTYLKRAPRLYTRETTVALAVDRAAGQTAHKVVVHLRLDGRTPGQWRVDRASWPVPAWEAIDGGEPLPTLAAAKAYATRWLRAAREQKTLHPRL